MRKNTIWALLCAALLAFSMVACDEDTTVTPTGDTVTGTDPVGEGDAGPTDPCDPNPCSSPPQATCDDGAAVTYGEGVCTDDGTDFSCEYEETSTACGEGEVCDNGACVNPCDPDPCTNPGDGCEGDTVVTYEANADGLCTVNDEGTAVCNWDAVMGEDCSASDMICYGGGCMDPGGEFMPSGHASYVYELVVGAAGDEACAFDVDGDGELDNQLGSLLQTISGFIGDLDVNGIIAENIQGGEIAMVFEQVGLDDVTDDEALVINGYVGIPLVADYDANLSGTAEFAVDPSSFLMGTTIPTIALDGAIAGGVLTAGGDATDVFTLSLPLFEGINAVMHVSGATIESSVSMNANETGLDWTGGKLGGVVPMDDIYGALNAYVSANCACLGLGETQLITYQGEGTKADCAATPDANCSGDEEMCGQIGSFCGIAVGIIQPDIDSDFSGEKDGISIGLCFEGVGAVITGIADE